MVRRISYFLKSISFLCILSVQCVGQIIIFDMFGVLFHIPARQKVNLMGITQPLAYALIDRQDPRKFTQKCLDFLSQVPESNTAVVKADKRAQVLGKPMPPIVTAWQSNRLSYKQALSATCDYIEKLDREKAFCSPREKAMVLKATHATFDLETRKNLYRPIAQGVALAQRCAAQLDSTGKRRHKLYILSNMDNDIIEHMKKAYPDIFALFDGIVISTESGSLKPDEHIYTFLINKYKLDISQCVFIDDQHENIVAAQSLGIKSLWCTNFTHVAQELENLSIVDKKQESQLTKIKVTGTLLIAGILVGFLWKAFYNAKSVCAGC